MQMAMMEDSADKPPLIMHDFMPHQGYADKKWAPEKINDADLRALARAEARASHTKIMPPETLKYFLANALVENRSGNYGVNPPELTVGKDRFATAANALGIKPKLFLAEYNSPAIPANPALGLEGVPARHDPARSQYLLAGVAPGYQFTFDQEKGTQDERNHNALMAAMILANKRGGTPQEVYTAWNGAGRIVDKATGKVVADANNHWAKVSAMESALNSMPANQKVVLAYKRHMNEALQELRSKKK
jgi:hypothetical protein